MSWLEDVKASPVARLAGYFAILTLILGGLAVAVPAFRDSLVPWTAPPVTGLDGALEPGAFREGLREGTIGRTLTDVFLALLAAVAFSAPVVWIYTVIMRQEGYDRSFVRMMTALPVVVAGVVQVVRGDLALAFALAGIVAAVRFRTTVKDLQNAVFAFAAIGIGLASGTENLLLAGALALVVCHLAYVMWRLNIGDVEPSLELGHGGIRLSEALVPGESHRPVVIGDREAPEMVHAEDLEDLSGSIERLADYVSADALRRKKKYNTLMLVYTDDEEAAKEKVEPILDEHTDRWVFVDRISQNGSELPALEYLLRLKKDVDVGKMVDRLGCADDALLRAAELKPIKGLRRRLT